MEFRDENIDMFKSFGFLMFVNCFIVMRMVKNVMGVFSF